MEGLKIERTSLTPQAASDIIETAVNAGSHGIGYWARVLKVQHIKDPNTPGQMLNASIVFEDMEGREPLRPGESDGAWTKPKRCKVHINDIGRAVGAILRDPVKTQAKAFAGRIVEEDHVDGPLADAIVQVACFGKVIYG
jgi:hypothetical protein